MHSKGYSLQLKRREPIITFQGSVFGPSSKIINNECGGEETVFPGGFESRRIKAFRYYTKYFGVPVLAPGQSDATLSCKGFEYPVRKGKDFRTFLK